MPSLTNIPDQLLQPDKGDDLVAWLSQQPIPYYHARTYVQLWSQLTKNTLTKTQWEKLEHALPRT